jgi:hypothetical protein
MSIRANPDEDLSRHPHHQACQKFLNDMIESGVEVNEAIEVMFCVALGNRVRIEGPQLVSASLIRLTMGLIHMIPTKPETSH